MSKIIELIRPEQAVDSISRNVAKIDLGTVNQVYVEEGRMGSTDMLEFPDGAVAIAEALRMKPAWSQRERLIIPEIFPLQAQTPLARFQRFQIPTWRLFAHETSDFSIEEAGYFKPPYRVIATRNFVAFDFYPLSLPYSERIVDNPISLGNPTGVMIRIPAGAGTKARFHSLRRGTVNVQGYPPAWETSMRQISAHNPIPLFETDLVPYETNYIYLFWGTLCFLPSGLAGTPDVVSSNMGTNAQNPLIRVEIFSEDYSAQRFESALREAFYIHPTVATRPKIHNVSNEQCVFLDGADGGDIIYEYVFQYDETFYPNLKYFQQINILYAPIVNLQRKISPKSTFLKSNTSPVKSYLSKA